MPCRRRREAYPPAKELQARQKLYQEKNKGETAKPAVNRHKASGNSGIGMGILRGRERAIGPFPSPYLKDKDTRIILIVD
jgi:hypothetical protein